MAQSWRLYLHEMKRLKVTVDGTAYEVAVEVLDEGTGAPPVVPAAGPALSAPVVSLAAPPPARPAPVSTERLGDVKSPLGGKIVSIDARPGQTVTEGQPIITLEAMKMNTYIYAPKSGRVESVHAHPGDAVEEGAVLLSIA